MGHCGQCLVDRLDVELCRVELGRRRKAHPLKPIEMSFVVGVGEYRRQLLVAPDPAAVIGCGTAARDAAG
jgi:hypothetical protein